ncbi:hypothetical protein NC981_21500 [Leptolyngbya sp. DQ-M1]|uniref:hypothetical protein n=1 Tax=Leptolyngbya sp. DQ-M1 TaxID=2933920 RepID=UPI00329861BE
MDSMYWLLVSEVLTEENQEARIDFQRFMDERMKSPIVKQMLDMFPYNRGKNIIVPLLYKGISLTEATNAALAEEMEILSQPPNSEQFSYL